MGKRRISEEVAFVKTLIKVAAFCIKKNAENLFTKLVASLPIAGNKNNKKRKKTWTCSKCKKNFQTKDNRARHEISCKKNEHLRKQIVNKAEARKNKVKPEENRNATQDKIKKKKQSGSKKKICALCKKEYVRIDAHYRNSHKIDLQVWINNLRGKLRTCNGTTCLQCNFDYKDVKSFRNHLIKDHNIRLLANTRKGRVKDKVAKTRKVVETATAVKEKVSIRNNRAVHEESGIMKDNTNAQEEDGMTKATAQKEKIRENPKLQDRGKPAVTHDVQKLCKHCNQFVSVSLMKNHIITHKSERETFPFKTRDSTRNSANSQQDDSSHTYERSNFMTLTDPNNETTEQNRIRDDENHGSSIHSEEEFQTTRNPQSVGTNSGEENATGSHDVSEDVYIPQKYNEEQCTNTSNSRR
ncbi:uncharacterized protein isoform X2 [Choristoneura fumiferana]|uniref:uncharacterized protein isoform X2 n=1 Tax=Choristoneura fumiferana TaxID=7141 RepID=UPI003D157C9E